MKKNKTNTFIWSFSKLWIRSHDSPVFTNSKITATPNNLFLVNNIFSSSCSIWCQSTEWRKRRRRKRYVEDLEIILAIINNVKIFFYMCRSVKKTIMSWKKLQGGWFFVLFCILNLHSSSQPMRDAFGKISNGVQSLTFVNTACLVTSNTLKKLSIGRKFIGT